MSRNYLIKVCIAVTAALTVFPLLSQKTILRTTTDPVKLLLDGKPVQGGWWLSPQSNPDVLTSYASDVTFISDIDTLEIKNLAEWESRNFCIVTDKGDSAHVRVDRISVNPFENPNPRLRKVAESGKLTKEQATFDIDALVYGLSQVHPDMFAGCRQADFFHAVNRAKESLPDSVSLMGLYQTAAPLVSMLGDGHTILRFPSDRAFPPDVKWLPVVMNVHTDHSLVCRSSIDSIIPSGAQVLSINGVNAEDIIVSMLPYVSGEREHFRIVRIDSMFPMLFYMLYANDTYDVEYRPAGSGKAYRHTFTAEPLPEIMKRSQVMRESRNTEDYSFTVDSLNNVAIMDFRRFSDISKMEHFADSMFTALKEKRIGNLIIDVRDNDGGNSGVGDVLLRYISPVPFHQIEKAIVRITPLTLRLMGSMQAPAFYLREFDSSTRIVPRTKEEGHYDGKVWLLTSNITFSSASMFAWAFRQNGMGTVIGEETGGMNVHFGDILSYSLPISGLRTSISWKRFWQPGADENDIHGTFPDIAVTADKALEKALKLARKNKRRL